MQPIASLEPPAHVPPSGAPPARARAGARLRRLGRAAERTLACVGVVALVYLLALDRISVFSSSMAPTLVGSERGGDLVLLERASLALGVAPRRGAIVTFRNSEGTTVVKRVVGLPGESIAIEAGRVVVDGRPLEPPAGVRYLAAGNVRADRDGPRAFATSSEGLYVLGDDARDSWDSRFTGELARDRVEGRAVAILWPPTRWRWLW